MKKIRTLLVKFDNQLQPWEVSAFRGAVIEKVGRENILFNNHLGEAKFRYRYPVVQYKSIHRQPAILCLGEGVEEIHKLFNQAIWEIDLKGRPMELEIDQLELKNFSLNRTENSQAYSLTDWVGLNSKNHAHYLKLTDEFDRMEMLEKILVGNILSFAKGMDWFIEERVRMRILKINDSKTIKYKNTPLKAFNLVFKTNVSLPHYIGLGKGVSKGFGVVQPIKI